MIFGESHLRRVLASYAAYYNQARTHLALGKDAPLGRAVQRSGVIVAIPILSGPNTSGYDFRKGQVIGSTRLGAYGPVIARVRLRRVVAGIVRRAIAII